jgi:lipopolysaccharide export system permease protein
MIISRYLTKEILSSLLALIIVLLLAFLCQQMVRYLNFVAVGKIPTGVLLKLVGFEIPTLLSLLLPLSLYLAILLAYGRLYADNEMSILQMSGFGNSRLIRTTLLTIILVTSIVLFLMLWINPLIAAKKQQVLNSDAATLHLIQTLIPGRFRASPDGKQVLYVEKLSRDHERAKNIFLAQEKHSAKNAQQNAWMLVLANEGYQVKDKQSVDQFFVIKDGYRYEGIPGQNDFKITKFKKYEIRLPQPQISDQSQEGETLSVRQLWHNYANPEHAAELQWRFSVALSAFLLALLAVPLSAVQPRKGRYLAILPSMLIYIMYIKTLGRTRQCFDITGDVVGSWNSTAFRHWSDVYEWKSK